MSRLHYPDNSFAVQYHPHRSVLACCLPDYLCFSQTARLQMGHRPIDLLRRGLTVGHVVSLQVCDNTRGNGFREITKQQNRGFFY